MQGLHPKGISSGHIEPRNMYSCGLKDNPAVWEKADGLDWSEGSRPECDMASIQVTTGV